MAYSDPEKCKAYKRRWCAENRDRVRTYARAYLIAHYDAIRASQRRSEKRHKEKYRLRRLGNANLRYARQKGVTTERVDYRAILARDGWHCHICRGRVTRKTLSFDHLIPLSKQGPHTARNLAVAHLRCNMRRGAGRLPAQLRLFG